MAEIGKKRLDIKVDKIYRRSLFRIPSTATLADAVREMKRKNAEELIVIDENGNGIGFLDSRDIVRLIASGQAKADEKVVNLMSTPLITVKVRDPIERACKVMCEKGIHHLVVIDETGRIRGVLNDLDVMKVLFFGGERE